MNQSIIQRKRKGGSLGGGGGEGEKGSGRGRERTKIGATQYIIEYFI